MPRIYRQPTVSSTLRAQAKQLRRQGSASSYALTGAAVPEQGVTASPNFVAGSAGWALYDNGNGEFNELTLRSGIIGNDALTNPVVPGYLFASANTFGVTTTLTNILTRNVTVPSGCTQLAASVTGRVYATNNTAGLDYLYGQANIAGFNGNALPLAVSGSNGTGTNISPFSVLLTGLTPGSNVAFQMAASTAFASWASNASNVVELSGLLLWFR